MNKLDQIEEALRHIEGHLAIDCETAEPHPDAIKHIESVRAALSELRQERDRMMEALKYYADQRNHEAALYTSAASPNSHSVNATGGYIDQGRRARATLAQFEKGEAE